MNFEIAYSYLNILNLSAKQGLNLYENKQSNSQKYHDINNNFQHLWVNLYIMDYVHTSLKIKLLTIP